MQIPLCWEQSAFAVRWSAECSPLSNNKCNITSQLEDTVYSKHYITPLTEDTLITLDQPVQLSVEDYFSQI